MIDEGYTKYECDWERAPALPGAAIEELNAWRNRLHEQGLIGHYPEHGVGFGNVSVLESDGDAFIISGTQTGHIARTDENHYARVTCCDIPANRVYCEGPVQASSEALTHAAIYALDPAIRAVVHVHHATLWRDLTGRIPTTAAEISYGTPEMAREFQRLYEETDFAALGIAVMGGHEEGLVSFGAGIAEAAERILSLRVLDLACDPASRLPLVSETDRCALLALSSGLHAVTGDSHVPLDRLLRHAHLSSRSPFRAGAFADRPEPAREVQRNDDQR